MTGVLIRILLRYIAAVLVAKGWLSPEGSDMFYGDPDLVSGIEMVAGAAIGLIAESWYWLARRWGWDR